MNLVHGAINLLGVQKKTVFVAHICTLSTVKEAEQKTDKLKNIFSKLSALLNGSSGEWQERICRSKIREIMNNVDY